MNNMQYRFSYYGKREMQDRLMKYYISKDYTFFLNHNSAELMRDINNDPEMFYAAVLNMLQLAAELCTSTIFNYLSGSDRSDYHAWCGTCDDADGAAFMKS